MSVRTNQIRWRDLALFLVVAALLGALVANCRSGGAKLNLSLSTSRQICETEGARRLLSGESYRDEEGNWVERTKVLGWVGISSVRVHWQARGGQEPYSLVIDSIAPYKGRPSSGSSGARMIGCADNSVGITHEYDYRTSAGPLYLADPRAESGWKTIQAVVTDANGDTAEATVDVYVVLVIPGSRHLLQGGQTYRTYGHLITVPDGINMWCCGAVTGHPRGLLSFAIEGYGSAYVLLDQVTFEEIERWLPAVDTQNADGVDLDAKLDAFVDSIGQLPDLDERVE